MVQTLNPKLKLANWFVTIAYICMWYRYFDQHGVIRDIVQSHILQTIALFAMEPPVTLDGEDIHNEKVFCLFFFWISIST